MRSSLGPKWVEYGTNMDEFGTNLAIFCSYLTHFGHRLLSPALSLARSGVNEQGGEGREEEGRQGGALPGGNEEDK